MPERIHDRFGEQRPLPAEHPVDTGHMSAEALLGAARDHQVMVIGPTPPDTGWQAKAPERFDLSVFTIDWQARTATCPTGAVATSWRPQRDDRGHDAIRFPDQARARRAVRDRCTRRLSEPRDLVVRPQAEHEALQHARREQATLEWKTGFNRRAGVEGAICQAVRGPDIRHARYRGLAKTHLQQLLSAAAINLVRIDAWLNGIPLARTRIAPLASLPAAT